MCGADTQYSLPSVDVSKERVSYEFSMGVPLPGPSAETLGPGPANYDPTPVDVFKKRMGCGVVFKERFGKEPLKKSLTEDAYCRYEGMAPVPPSETGTKFGSEIQRPDLTNKNTNPTLKCYASHKPGTPSTYTHRGGKHPRAQRVSIGPTPGCPMEPRFRRTRDLTRDAYLAAGNPEEQMMATQKRRNPAVTMQAPLPKQKSRSAINDLHMERLCLHSIFQM